MLPKLVAQKIEENKTAMLQTLQDLIAIPSIATEKPENGYPYGSNCANALDSMLQTAASFGLHTKNLAYHVGTADTDATAAPYLGILAHLDVVPVMAENWHTPPFTAVIQDDCVFGRGAIDDKGPAVAALYAVKAIMDARISLKKPVRLLFGCNEENGSTDLEYYHAHDTMPPLVFTPDGSYPLIGIEKGMMRLAFHASIPDPIHTLQAGTAPNAVPAQAICTLSAADVPENLPENCTVSMTGETAQLIWNGQAAHASTPETGNNAITGLLQLLAEQPKFAGCRALAACFPHSCTDGSGLGIACSDETSGALTCICSQMQIQNGELTGMIDVRYPLCTTKEAVFQTVQERLQVAGFACEIVIQNDPHAVPEESELVQTLLRVYEEETGEKGKCLAIGGGTYVHEIDGGVAFGAEFPEWDYHMHGDDEFVPIAHLMKDVRMMAAAILEICGIAETTE